MTFYRMFSDKARQPINLKNQFAGTDSSACWLIGGGPSLRELPIDQVIDSPVPKLTTNLAGHGLLRPDFWTSYDPSARFDQSIYLDPSVMKFVHPRRAMDLVPETSVKVCDCPNLYLFETDTDRGFGNFLSAQHPGIVDWNDTLVQAIDILYQLGFRRLYLAGCEMIVHPGPTWLAEAEKHDIQYQPYMLLGDFSKECENAGLCRQRQEELGTADQYHFDEQKPLAAAINTDQHYFRVAQYLRLSRRAISLAGMQIISVTAGSRLNEYFPYQTVESACQTESERIGYAPGSSVKGFYTQQTSRKNDTVGPMRDFRPHHWKENPKPVQCPPDNHRHAPEKEARKNLDEYLNDPPAIEIREDH